MLRSPLPDVAIPDVPLAQFVLSAARSRGEKPALVDDASGRTITYAELASLVDRAAAGLHHRGFGKGDALAMLSPNVPEYAVLCLAAAACGGAVTTLNPAYTAGEIARQVDDAGAGFLFTVPELAAKAAGLRLREKFVLGETSFVGLLRTVESPPEVPIAPGEDVVALPYSSGTTGLPKGVMLTHRNLVANMVQLQALDHVSKADTLLAVLPFFHIYGLVVVLNLGLAAGATIVTMPRFELEAYLAALERHRVTLAHVVPPIVLQLAKSPSVEGRDLSSVRKLFSGAAPLGEELTRACEARLACTIRQGYGMTEASPATHMSPREKERIKPGSVGVLLPSTECRIVDPASGRDLGAGEPGEILVRGPQVMKGYLNQPAATAATLDPESWLHTGDIGTFDADGQFSVVDRLKELIKYKGLQVAPAEIEALLLSHPGIADAAVVGIPDEAAGEVPKAYVVLRSPVPEAEITAFVAARAAPHKCPRRCEIVERIPRSPSGKILRRLLVERDGSRT